MDKEWIPIITSGVAVLGTLFGIFIGGAFSALVKLLELKHLKKEQEKKLMLEKLEELSGLLFVLQTNLHKFKDKILLFSEERPDSVDEIYGFVELINSPIMRIATLGTLYFPSLYLEMENTAPAIIKLLEAAHQFFQDEKFNRDDLQIKAENAFNAVSQVASKLEIISCQYISHKDSIKRSN